MIDYLFCFADQPTAQADPVVGAYWRAGVNDNPGSWRGDVCIPGVQVWNPAQDTTTPATGPGGIGTVNVVTHTYQPGWWIIIALPVRNAALDGLAALILTADRDLANAGEPMTSFVLYSKEPLSSIEGLMLAPTFAGSNYPFGNA
jgi:hypothetical protein